jgi:hypothetical protein
MNEAAHCRPRWRRGIGAASLEQTNRRWGNDLVPAWVVYTVGTIAITNFFSFVIVSLIIGGDAWNGYESGGHYFLSEKGRLTEVTRGVWEYSRWHLFSVFVTHLLAAIVGYAGRGEPAK